jgi:hypothetical protein
LAWIPWERTVAAAAVAPVAKTILLLVDSAKKWENEDGNIIKTNII